MTDTSDPIHPGTILYDQAMRPLGVSRNKLARDIDVPVGRISDIVAGKRGITPDSALRLGRYFGTSAEMWMQFQTDYDLHVARRTVWHEIAPRVREMETAEEGAVAPVTAMDGHPEAADDYDPHWDSHDEPETDITDPPGIAESVDRSNESPEDIDAKWWSAPLSETAVDTSDEHTDTGREAETPDPVCATPEVHVAAVAPEPAADDAVVAATQTRERTITLDVRPADGSAGAVEEAPTEPIVSEDVRAAIEQTFEIDVRPSAAASDVVTEESEPAGEEDGPAEAPAPRRKFTVEVVRGAAEASSTPDEVAVGEPEPAAEGESAIEFDEDNFAGEIPDDAFESEFDDAFAQEAVVEQEQYAPVMARTGTDDIGQMDPPLSAPGRDAGASALLVEPANVRAEIDGMTPASWSNALQSESAAASGPAVAEAFEPAEAASGEVFDVPAPSELDPKLDAPMPPWPPVEHDDTATSLDIPDPEEARKLYEYDD